ncbi:hypothetical protein [Actinomadura sp. KC216]|uniref:hypothetical protein n=1 Tax=Actinomadura sp. KC216 TaxID=2530370 RepID=UPI001404314F|nr:hypothetical protein [Actinomadura sp. KC216]
MAAPTPRICRTRDEAFAAGWNDGLRDRETHPLTTSEQARLAVLLRPYLTDKARKTA